MDNNLCFGIWQTFSNTNNSLWLYYAFQAILIVFYAVIGFRSWRLGKKLTGHTDLGQSRKKLLGIIPGVCVLFVIAEVLMILKVETLFVWFFFDLSMGLVYASFISLVKKDNHD